MRERALAAASWVALVTVGLLVACDRKSDVQRTVTGPTDTVSTTRLEVAGPDSIAPGESVQFQATAFMSDGSTRNVTSEAAWHSYYSSIASVSSSSGLATGHDRGETDIRAMFQGLSSAKHVLVLPAGTFKLSGRVHEAGFGVSGARVEVTAGSARGLSTLSSSGSYRLYGVEGETQVRVTKDDYEPRVENVHVSGHQTLDIELTLTRPRPDITGTYTMTIAAAAECGSLLPEQARVRTYTATVTPDDRNPAGAVVTLQGAVFAVGLDSFRGTVGLNSVQFTLNGPFDYFFYDYSSPDVIELLGPSTYYIPWGRTEGAVTSGRLSGTFDGTIEVRTGPTPRNPLSTTGCQSANHQLVLSR